MKITITLFTCFILISKLTIAQNQDSLQKATAAQGLALKLANPLASMISVPFQFNLMVGVGQYNGSQLITNFQPVIAFKAGKVNIITRTIVPFIENRNVFEAGSTTFGLSDINFSAFRIIGISIYSGSKIRKSFFCMAIVLSVFWRRHNLFCPYNFLHNDC